MQGAVHELIGVGAVAILAVAKPKGFSIGDQDIMLALSIAPAALGSLLPDIDMQTTKMGHRHKIVSKVVNKVGGGHRGITHTLLIPALTVGLYIFLKNYLIGMEGFLMVISSILFGFLAGYLLHIFADMFNGKGCPLLWPLSSSKVHIADLPSSGKVPYVFAVLLLAAEFFILFKEVIFNVLG